MHTHSNMSTQMQVHACTFAHNARISAHACALRCTLWSSDIRALAAQMRAHVCAHNCACMGACTRACVPMRARAQVHACVHASVRGRTTSTNLRFRNQRHCVFYVCLTSNDSEVWRHPLTKAFNASHTYELHGFSVGINLEWPSDRCFTHPAAPELP